MNRFWKNAKDERRKAVDHNADSFLNGGMGLGHPQGRNNTRRINKQTANPYEDMKQIPLQKVIYKQNHIAGFRRTKYIRMF